MNLFKWGGVLLIFALIMRAHRAFPLTTHKVVYLKCRRVVRNVRSLPNKSNTFQIKTRIWIHSPLGNSDGSNLVFWWFAFNRFLSSCAAKFINQTALLEVICWFCWKKSSHESMTLFTFRAVNCHPFHRDFIIYVAKINALVFHIYKLRVWMKLVS